MYNNSDEFKEEIKPTTGTAITAITANAKDSDEYIPSDAENELAQEDEYNSVDLYKESDDEME